MDVTKPGILEYLIGNSFKDFKKDFESQHRCIVYAAAVSVFLQSIFPVCLMPHFITNFFSRFHLMIRILCFCNESSKVYYRSFTLAFQHHTVTTCTWIKVLQNVKKDCSACSAAGSNGRVAKSNHMFIKTFLLISCNAKRTVNDNAFHSRILSVRK